MSEVHALHSRKGRLWGTGGVELPLWKPIVEHQTWLASNGVTGRRFDGEALAKAAGIRESYSATLGMWLPTVLNFENCDLEGVDLSFARIPNAYFTDGDARRTRFVGATCIMRFLPKVATSTTRISVLQVFHGRPFNAILKAPVSLEHIAKVPLLATSKSPYGPGGFLARRRSYSGGHARAIAFGCRFVSLRAAAPSAGNPLPVNIGLD